MRSQARGKAPETGRIQAAVLFVIVQEGARWNRCAGRPPGPADILCPFVNLVVVLRAPDGRQRRRINIIDGLDGLLDDGMAGGNHVAFAIPAAVGIGKNMQFPGLRIHEFPPEVLVQFSGDRIHFVIILIHESRDTDLFGIIEKTSPRSVMFYLILPEK